MICEFLLDDENIEIIKNLGKKLKSKLNKLK